jgi:hypothetical protein
MPNWNESSWRCVPAAAAEAIDYTREDVTDGTRQWDVIVDTGAAGRCRSCGGRSRPPGRW